MNGADREGGDPFVSAGRTDPAYLKEFLLSAREILEAAEQAAVSFGSTGNAADLETVFRGMHTLKGDSGYLGFSRLGAFCHEMETLLSRMRKQETGDLSAAMDTVFHGLDVLRSAMAVLEAGGTGGPDPEPVLAEIRALTGQVKEQPRQAPPAETAGTHPDTPAAESSAGTNRGFFEVFLEQASSYRLTLDAAGTDIPEKAPRLQAVRRALTGLARAAEAAGFPEIAGRAGKAGSILSGNNREAYPDAIRDLIRVLDTATGRTPLSPEAERRAHGFEVQPEKSAHRSLRVDEDKIDRLVALVNEFDLAQSRSGYLAGRARAVGGENDELPRAISEQAAILTRLVGELREQVSALRTVQAQSVLKKYERLVRDIARAEGKKIRFTISGGSLEIDKTVADTLSEPLTHAIRNACDHGIETPSARRERGKPQEGTVSVDISQDGRDLIVTVRDDGRGIDRAQLVSKAEQLGIPLDGFPGDSIFELIFLPGFSTSESLSEISGRGLGMDIIRTSVRGLGGQVAVQSFPGTGTVLTLTVPVMAGVREALLIEASGRLYAFPLETVREVLTESGVQLHTVEGKTGFMSGDEFIPAAEFERILEVERSGPEPAGSVERKIIVLSRGETKGALIVQRILRTMELSVRPAPENLKEIPVIAGVSVLGDGRIVLLLNAREVLGELTFATEPVLKSGRI